jgi:TPR repeat protein
MKNIRMTLLAVALAAAASQAVQAQAPAAAASASQRHADGLRLEHRGDDKGAFAAHLEAAEAGHAPAQRRVAEIYDSGNHAVERDFGESMRWYEKARLGGEKIPPPKSPIPSFTTTP